jgi:flagellar hook-associated protein FlgK
MRKTCLLLITPMLLSAPVLAAPITQGAPGAVPPDQFSIMTNSEIAEHKRVMAGLNGTAREDYRNTQYRMLKQRAMAQGYLLPNTPPWGHTEVLPASQPPQTDMPALIEQQRKVVQQALAAQPNTPPATDAAPKATAQAEQPPAPEGSAPAPVDTAAKPASVPAPQMSTETSATPATPTPQAPATATADNQPGESSDAALSPADEQYRQMMRDRFDTFLEQRQARQSRLEQQREQAQMELEARREERRQAAERRRQAFMQQNSPSVMAPPQPVVPTAPGGVPYSAPYGGYAYPPQPYYYPPQR